MPIHGGCAGCACVTCRSSQVMESTEALAGPHRGRRLVSWIDALAGLTGWRRALAAAICGALATAAMPPLYLVPALLVAFPGLLWLLCGVSRPAAAFWTGWFFGLGHFVSGLYWVGIAFLVEAEKFAAVMPFAVVGLAAGLAIFPALAVLASWRLGARLHDRLILLAGFWLLAEWLRATVLTGFPWNLLGTVWAFSPTMLQLASVTGVWGLSVVTLLAAGAPALLYEPGHPRPVRRSLPWAAALLALPVLIWIFGTVRLALAPEPGSDLVADVRLRLVQPAIPQELKWVPELRAAHVRQQMGMTLQPGFDQITHVIWSEAAVPFLLPEEDGLRRSLGQAVPPDGLLLTGAPRARRLAAPEGSGLPAGEVAELWNSLHALDRQGDIQATYDKFHLVPFGEYMPLRWIPGLTKLATGRVDFSPGPGPQTLSLSGLPPVSPLICYEVIFPGRVVADSGAERPSWLLNLTNDAWFGISSGPYQQPAPV